jgi:hypothetical protein
MTEYPVNQGELERLEDNIQAFETAASAYACRADSESEPPNSWSRPGKLPNARSGMSCGLPSGLGSERLTLTLG